jgi:hypothetical protein
MTSAQAGAAQVATCAYDSTGRRVRKAAGPVITILVYDAARRLAAE